MTVIRRAIALILLTILSQTTGLTLESFTGTYDGESITVEWETSSEIDIYFFYLERSLQASSGFDVLFEYIPAEGDPENGWYYGVIDDDVVEGTTYYYRLVAVDFDEVEYYYGPIAVNAGDNPIPATSTSTPSPSATAPPASATPTQSVPSTPTHTPGSLDTSAPTQTLEAGAETSTSAPSLDSMPTLEYTAESTPTDTPTPLPPPTDVSLPTPAPAQTEAVNGPAQITVLVRIALLSVILGIWVVLAIGGYIYIRKHFP